MLLRVVVIFLVGIVILAMFGKLRNPVTKQRIALKCAKCGKYILTKGPCACERQ